MPRIPESEIEQLKKEVSVQHLIESAHIPLKKSGKDLIGVWPFHADREPSLIVTPVKNLWHCFSCQIGGGPIDWMIKKNSLSFRQAVEHLRGLSPFPHAGTRAAAVAVDPAPKNSAPANKPQPPLAFDVDDQTLLNDTIAYYHQTLKTSPEAQS